MPRYPKIDQDVLPPAFSLLVDDEFLDAYADAVCAYHCIGPEDLPGVVSDYGTAWWRTCLAVACRQTGTPELLELYDGLEWHDSDVFDAMMSELVVWRVSVWFSDMGEGHDRPPHGQRA